MMKVLVVEDEEMIRKGIVLAVDWAALDCVVVGEASNGEEGLQAAERYAPTLIITDLKMPKMDGIELEQAVQALRRRMEPSQGEPAIPGLKKGDKSKYVLQAMSYIGEHYDNPNITVAEIAQSIGISEGHLSHTFKKETDYTLLNYLTRYRIHKAMELLRDCRVKVYEVAQQVGYKDITYFSATFKKVVGISPSEYQDTSH